MTSPALIAALSGLLLTLLTSLPLYAQGRGGQPDQSLPLVQQAFKLSDARFLMSFSRYCMLNGPNTANGKGEAATPSQLFDNLYYVGKTDVGAWVLKTNDGLILFDTLNTRDEAANIIVPGMRKLGLNPDDIKLVILTHAHNDHSGGMSYFKDKGIRIMVSEVDWKPLGGVPNPESVIHDGQVINMGGTAVTLYLIPGHTAGTIGAIFPVTQGGRRHVMAFTGGIGPTGGPAEHEQAIASIKHFSDAAKQMNVDAFIDPHEAIIDTVAWGYVMHPEERKKGENDLVIGGDRFQKFAQMVSTCLQARIVMYRQQAGNGRGAATP